MSQTLWSPPPWAQREAEAVGKEVCGVVSCRRKVGGSSARCFGCKQALLCGTHKGVLCTACNEPANEAPAAQTSNALPSHFPTMLTCLMPGGGELLTAHYAVVPFDASPVPQDTTPAPSDCSFRVQHEDDAPLPQPGVGGCRMVLKTRPGTILVVNGGRFAGFQVPTTDNDEVMAWRWNLLPPRMPIMDISVLAASGHVRDNPQGKKGDYMCACHQVNVFLSFFAFAIFCMHCCLFCPFVTVLSWVWVSAWVWAGGWVWVRVRVLVWA